MLEKIISVYELKNAILVNSKSNEKWGKRKFLIIEDIDKGRKILDLNTNLDITDTYMEVEIDKKKTRVNVLFENAMFKSE